MRSFLRQTRILRARLSRLLILVVLLGSTAAYAESPTAPESSNDTVTYNAQDRAGKTAAQDLRDVSIASISGGGAVSYWLLAFLLAANIAGVIYMRRWAATIESREDKD